MNGSALPTNGIAGDLRDTLREQIKIRWDIWKHRYPVRGELLKTERRHQRIISRMLVNAKLWPSPYNSTNGSGESGSMIASQRVVPHSQ